MKKKRNVFASICIYLVMMIAVALVLFPLYLLVINAFKNTKELLGNYFGLPSVPTLDNFKNVFQKANYTLYLGNSVIITVVSLLLVFLIIPSTSLVIARRMDQHKYFKFLYFFLILGIFVPFQTKMLSLVKLMATFKLMNIPGLIILYLVGAMTTDVYLMVGFLRAIPRDMEEAAIVDGCSRLKSIFLIVYPVIMPMISAILIKDALWFWNDFLMPTIILGGNLKSWTLQLFQYNFKSTYSTDYTLAYAAYLVSMLPILLLYLFASKQITEGLTEGAVKA